MPKTAGTTLERIFVKSLPKESVLNHFNHEHQLKELSDKSLAQLARIRYIRGHFAFGLHEWFPQPCIYLTFLRDPLERILSEFFFLKKNPDRAMRIPVFRGLGKLLQRDSFDLEDFANHLSEHPGFSNAQTRWLSGHFPILEDPPYEPVPARALNSAKLNLTNSVHGLGITEQFNESLVAVAQALDLPVWDVLYEPRRINASRPKAKELPSRTIRLLENQNLLDLDLYQFALNLAQERRKKAGYVFVLNWVLFQALQRTYRTSKRAPGPFRAIARRCYQLMRFAPLLGR